MIFRIGKYIFSEKVGILSALFLSVSPFHIYYSQELTSYSLSLLLALFSSYFFLKILRNPNRTVSFCYVFTTLAFIYTHYMNIIFLMVQIMFLCIFYHKNKPMIKKCLYLQSVILLLSLPSLAIISVHSLKLLQTDLVFWVPQSDLRMLLQTFMVFSLGYHASWLSQLVTLIICLLFSLRAVYYWHRNKDFYYLIFWLIIPLSIIWLISQIRPLYLHRMFFFVLPAFCLLVAAGIARTNKYLAMGTFCLYSTLIAFTLNNYYENKFNEYAYDRDGPRYPGVQPRKDYKKAAIYVAENFQERDIIFHISRSSLMPFVLYWELGQLPSPGYGIKVNGIYDKEWERMKFKTQNRYAGMLLPTERKDSLICLGIKDKSDLSKYKRVWLIHSAWEFQGKDPQENDRIGKDIIGWFDKNFSRKKMQMLEGINIYLFDKL